MLVGWLCYGSGAMKEKTKRKKSKKQRRIDKLEKRLSKVRNDRMLRGRALCYLTDQDDFGYVLTVYRPSDPIFEATEFDDAVAYILDSREFVLPFNYRLTVCI